MAPAMRLPYPGPKKGRPSLHAILAEQVQRGPRQAPTERPDPSTPNRGDDRRKEVNMRETAEAAAAAADP